MALSWALSVSGYRAAVRREIDCHRPLLARFSANELLGMSLRAQAWSSEAGSKIVDTRHAITERIPNRELGVRERLNPTFWVDDEDPGLTVLAEYAQSGLPSMAVREHRGWKSVFCGEPLLTNDLFRGLCKFAGVHLFTPFGEDSPHGVMRIL